MLFDAIQHLSPSEALELTEDFQRIMKRSTHEKNEIIHHEGTICDHIYLIEDGIARAFYYKDGKDITAHFATSNSIITAIDSFIQRKKSRYNIELVVDSTLISFANKDLEQLLINKPHYEKYFRMLLEQLYIDLAQRTEDLLFFDAKDRYDKLMKETPELIQKVPLMHIASFIGITQETLSRIRAKS